MAEPPNVGDATARRQSTGTQQPDIESAPELMDVGPSQADISVPKDPEGRVTLSFGLVQQKVQDWVEKLQGPKPQPIDLGKIGSRLETLGQKTNGGPFGRILRMQSSGNQAGTFLVVDSGEIHVLRRGQSIAVAAKPGLGGRLLLEAGDLVEGIGGERNRLITDSRLIIPPVRSPRISVSDAVAPGEGPASRSVEDGRVRVDVAKSSKVPGSLEIWATDQAGQSQLRGQLFRGADGKTIYVGTYDKIVRNYFQAARIQQPDSFFLPGSKPTQPFLADDHLLNELWKYFDEKGFLPVKPGEAPRYQPRTFYVTSDDHFARFYKMVRHFFGADVEESRANWLDGGKHDLQNRLGRYQVLPQEGLSLEGGGRLRFASDGAVEAVLASGRSIPLKFPPSISERAVPIPASLPEGARFQIETIGLSAPGSAEGLPTHKIVTVFDPVQNKNIAISFDRAQSVYTNVDIFAISHHHADHFDPRLLLAQLIHNSKFDRSTTLLMAPDVAETVLTQVAEGVGYEVGGETTPVQYLNERGLFVSVTNELQVGETRVEMVSGYRGAHGPAQSGIAIWDGKLLAYFDPSDGDFDPQSMLQRKGGEEKAIQEIDQKLESIKKQKRFTPGDFQTVDDLREEKAERQRVVQEIDRNLEYGRRAETLAVDQGTSGKDTHGGGNTVRNWRRLRLEGDAEALLSRDAKSADKILDMADRGEWARLEKFLRNAYRQNHIAQPEAYARNIVRRLRGVTATHNIGYGFTRGLPEIAEGRVETFGKNGVRRVVNPKFESELKNAGFDILLPEEEAIHPSKAVIEFEGSRVVVSRSNEARFSKGLLSLLDKYTIHGTDPMSGKPVSACRLQTMTIDGVPVAKTSYWAHVRGRTELKSSGKTAFDLIENPEIAAPQKVSPERAVLTGEVTSGTIEVPARSKPLPPRTLKSGVVVEEGYVPVAEPTITSVPEVRLQSPMESRLTRMIDLGRLETSTPILRKNGEVLGGILSGEDGFMVVGQQGQTLHLKTDSGLIELGGPSAAMARVSPGDAIVLGDGREIPLINTREASVPIDVAPSGETSLLEGSIPYVMGYAVLASKLAEHFHIGTADQRAGAGLGMLGGTIAAAPLAISELILMGPGILFGGLGMRKASHAIGNAMNVETLKEGGLGNVFADWVGEMAGGMAFLGGAIKIFGIEAIEGAGAALWNGLGAGAFAAEGVAVAALPYLLIAAAGGALGYGIHASGIGRVIHTDQAGEWLGDKIYSWTHSEELPRVTKRSEIKMVKIK